MIVVDTNVISYLLLPMRFTEAAERLLAVAPEWVAPYLGLSRGNSAGMPSPSALKKTRL